MATNAALSRTLFRAIERRDDRSREKYTKQTGTLKIDHRLLAPGAVVAGDSRFTLELFEDGRYEVAIDSVAVDINGVQTILGHIAGQQLGTFSLSEKNGIILADLSDPLNGRFFKVKTSSVGGEHIVLEYDLESMPATYDVSVTNGPNMRNR